MSYAQRKELSGNRTLAIILVAILQLGLGYAIVTGLAYNVIKKAAQDLKTFDVEEQPPPPEEPPPPLPELDPGAVAAAAAALPMDAPIADANPAVPRREKELPEYQIGV